MPQILSPGTVARIFSPNWAPSTYGTPYEHGSQDPWLTVVVTGYHEVFNEYEVENELWARYSRGHQGSSLDPNNGGRWWVSDHALEPVNQEGVQTVPKYYNTDLFFV